MRKAWLLMLLVTSCNTIDLDKIENLNGGKIDIVGHGGAGFQSLVQPLPTNSFSSIKNAIDGWNADGIEIDLKVTSDSVLVLYHDDILETNTNCAGCPEYYTSKDILNCKFKNYYGSRVVNEENLISFQELINHFKDRDRKPHIFASTKYPTKCTDQDPNAKLNYVKAMVKIIADNNAYSWISVYDGYPELLNEIRALDPDIDLIFNAEEFNDGIDKAITFGYSGIVIDYEGLTKDQVKFAHANNKTVTVWGMVTRKSIKDAIDLHPDGLMTDNIPLTAEF